MLVCFKNHKSLCAWKYFGNKEKATLYIWSTKIHPHLPTEGFFSLWTLPCLKAKMETFVSKAVAWPLFFLYKCVKWLVVFNSYWNVGCQQIFLWKQQYHPLPRASGSVLLWWCVFQNKAVYKQYVKAATRGLSHIRIMTKVFWAHLLSSLLNNQHSWWKPIWHDSNRNTYHSLMYWT